MIKQFAILSKFRVVALMLLCAWVGMMLTPIPNPFGLSMLFGLLGIGLLAAAGGAMNQLAEQALDGTMKRTAKRPLVQTTLNRQQVWTYIGLTTCLGTTVLLCFTNPLTTWLTLGTMMGYGILYTLILKPNTHQNIVIGGLFGAMPPLLGWCALTNQIDATPLILVLIIFFWTPAHFWPLAIAHKNDYAKTKWPMLPVTHGITFTKLSIIAYALLTTISTLMPFCIRMTGHLYLSVACILNLRWLYLCKKLWEDTNTASGLFKFSIYYILIIFFLLLLDHKTPVPYV